MDISESTLEVYRSIAEDACTAARDLWHQAHPFPLSGLRGISLTPDPSDECLKQSLIAITFSAIYLEALLHQAGTRKEGVAWEKRWDHRIDERKLPELGITDPELIEAAQRFRESHNNLIHEKAIFANRDAADAIQAVYHEATAAIAFIHRISEAFEVCEAV